MHARPPTGRSGFTLGQALFSLALMALVSGGGYYYMQQQAHQQRCAKNLAGIYMALEMYEIDRGQLPGMAFFPDDPLNDNDSLEVVLSKYGVNRDLCICPASAPSLRHLGLTYVWNVNLNGMKLHEPGRRDWMLVEMNALSDQVPPPHLGTYNILYTDGKVEASATPPPGLRVP